MILYWTSGKNSSELIELSSTNKISFNQIILIHSSVQSPVAKVYKREQSRVVKKTTTPMIYVTRTINHLSKDLVIVVRATVSILGKLGRGQRQEIFHFLKLFNRLLCYFICILNGSGHFASNFNQSNHSYSLFPYI